MLTFISIFHKYYAKISYFIATLITLFLAGLGFSQLIYRYIVGRTLVWGPDVTIFGITTVAALTIPPLWLDNDNMTMDLLAGKLSKTGDFVLSCIIDAVSLIMAAVVAYSGYLAVVHHVGYVSSILRYDDSLRYVFVLYMGVMLTFCIALSLIRRILEFKQGGSQA